MKIAEPSWRCMLLALLLTAGTAGAGCGSDGGSASDVPTLTSPESDAVVDNGCYGGSNQAEWSFD